MSKEIKIMRRFNNFTDGVRVLMLIYRNKEGGKDRVSRRKIVINREEFEEVLTEFLEIKKLSVAPLRIYCSVNRRDLEKGIREFKRLQLEADYYDEKSRHSFYTDIRNRFMSALMKPGSRAETYFLIDIDDIIKTKKDWDISIVEKHLEEIGVRVILQYPTKNGVHIITEPFNPSKWNSEFGTIKKDALLLLDF